jgi:hypothetical protein
MSPRTFTRRVSDTVRSPRPVSQPVLVAVAIISSLVATVLTLGELSAAGGSPLSPVAECIDRHSRPATTDVAGSSPDVSFGTRFPHGASSDDTMPRWLTGPAVTSQLPLAARRTASAASSARLATPTLA